VDLDGARCLITGCSSGIGRALARALADEGAHVFATGRSVAALADLAAEGLSVLEVDVRDDASIRRAVREAGHVDVLVNNAGYGLAGAVEEIADEELLAQYDVNVFGVWRCCRAVLPGMRERRRGAIVVVSSFGGIVPYPGIGAYRSSKFAVEGIAWTLHLEVARFGIRVIDVLPGLTDSAFDRNMVRARGMTEASPYAEMHARAAAAYPNMSPAAIPARRVADAIVAELRAEPGRRRLAVGEDAERVMAVAARGDAAYELYLVHDLGFDWHPAAA
jgi:NAD(P)-dependent dehydrogenase (short-subunit alcohol dehydrogenase family)